MSSPPQREDFTVGDAVRGRNSGDEFVIKRVLKGGFGVVYIAELRGSGDLWVLKTFQARFLWRDEERERFLREAVTWVMLERHPHIVTANNIDHIEGFPCLVLEYIDGGDLAQLLRDTGPLDLQRALKLAFQFCDAMQYAHEKLRLVHRDVKPANCLITTDGDLKVTDFGLARPFDPAFDSQREANDRVALVDTVHTTVIGTPQYMAPEQFNAKAQLDTRTDIHAFGVMLYEMLTGDLPLRGSVARAHIETNAAEYNLQDVLREMILRCVDPEPSNRPQDFTAVRQSLAELNRFLFETDAPAVVSPEPMSEWDWAHKGMALWALEFHAEALNCLDRAVDLDPENAVLLSNKAVALRSLGRAEEALACYDRGLELEPNNYTLWSNKGIDLVDLERYEEAIACYDRGLENALEHRDLLKNKAVALGALGRAVEALACENRALEIDPRDPILWANKGKSLVKLERHEEALACYDRGLEIAPRDRDLWYSKGEVLVYLERSEEAIRCFDRVLEISPGDYAAFNAKGFALLKLERPEEAIECFDRGLEIEPDNNVLAKNKADALKAIRKKSRRRFAERMFVPIFLVGATIAVAYCYYSEIPKRDFLYKSDVAVVDGKVCAIKGCELPASGEFNMGVYTDKPGGDHIHFDPRPLCEFHADCNAKESWPEPRLWAILFTYGAYALISGFVLALAVAFVAGMVFG